MHLLVDLFGCPPGKLDDPDVITSLLIKARDELSLVPALEASIHGWKTHSSGLDGEAGLLQLTDGHIYVITRPIIGTAWVSLFRLEDFDHTTATAFFVRELLAETADLQVIQRGPIVSTPRMGPTAPWLRTGRPKG